jgi:hypothetical protein
LWEQGALSDLSLRNFLILKERGHIFELPKSKEALLKAKAEMQSVSAEQCSVRGLRGGGLPVRSISLSSRSGYKDI